MQKDRTARDTGNQQHRLCDRRLYRTGKRRSETLRLCIKFFKDDIPASAHAGSTAGTDLQRIPDYKWRTISQISAVFALGCDMVGSNKACKVFGKGVDRGCSAPFCICKKENDREINEWYNEEKIRRQIGIYEQEVLIDQVEEILRCFKMRKIKIILCISSLIAIILSSCGKQEPNIDLASIDISDIDSVEHTGTTGGQNGGYSYSFQKAKATDLLSC